MDNTQTNSYAMQYYRLSDTENIAENEVRLVSIAGSDGTLYDALMVRNILGKKILIGSGTMLQDLEKATLTFEKNGKEMTLLLSR